MAGQSCCKPREPKHLTSSEVGLHCMAGFDQIDLVGNAVSMGRIQQAGPEKQGCKNPRLCPKSRWNTCEVNRSAPLPTVPPLLRAQHSCALSIVTHCHPDLFHSHPGLARTHTHTLLRAKYGHLSPMLNFQTVNVGRLVNDGCFTVCYNRHNA